MMNENKEVCGCCHAEYFVDENNNWQLVETRRIADLGAENEQLQRQYEGQRTAARVNWDKVKALEAENEKFRNAVWEALDGLYGGDGSGGKLPIELLPEDRQQLFHKVLELIGETAGG